MMLFFTVSLGGYGGSHRYLSSNLSPNAGFDFDSDGKMDFLDFDDVPQYHLGDNTTDTVEQLDEVKSGLNLSGSYNDVTVSADMTQKMTDTFKQANARVNIN